MVSRQEFEEDYLKKKKEEYENERAFRKKRPMDRDEAGYEATKFVFQESPFLLQHQQ